MVTLPIVYSACFLLIFYFLNRKMISKNDFYKIAGFYCTYLVTLVIIYFLFGEKPNSSVQKIDLSKIIFANPFHYFKTFINCFIGSILLTKSGVLIYFLPYFFFS